MQTSLITRRSITVKWQYLVTPKSYGDKLGGVGQLIQMAKKI
jgi:hypothetical protein